MRFSRAALPSLAILTLASCATACADSASADSSALRANSDRLVLHVVGDVAWPDGRPGTGLIDEAKEQLFALVRPILSKGDLNFANFECPLTTAPAEVKKTYPLTCNPKRLRYAIDGGLFNLFSLANNHARDAGDQGIADTLANFAQATTAKRPIWWAGIGSNQAQAGAPLTVEVPGKNTRLALIALANTGPETKVGSLHARDLPDRIANAAASHDIVVVSVHFGPEYIHTPSKETVDRFHAMIDAGADLVVAHHAHVVQGVERYKKGFIFYNLGNFSFGSHTRRHLETEARMYSMIGRVTFLKNQLESVELVPLYVNNVANWTIGDKTLPPRHATPQPLEGAFADYAIDEFRNFASSVPTEKPTKLHKVGTRLFADLGGGPPPPERRMAAMREQADEYHAARAAGGGPRPATPAEQAQANRAGTPVGAAALFRALEGKKKNKRARPGAKKRRSNKGHRRNRGKRGGSGVGAAR